MIGPLIRTVLLENFDVSYRILFQISTYTIAIAIITVSGFAGVMIALQFQPLEPIITETNPLMQYPFSSYENFSDYTDYETSYSINAPQYTIAPDLSNIENLESMRRLEEWNDDIEDRDPFDWSKAWSIYDD